MKKKYIALSILLSGFCEVAQAKENNFHNFYLGSEYSIAKYNSSNLKKKVLEINNTKIDSHVSLGILCGYQFNSSFALEFSYNFSLPPKLFLKKFDKDNLEAHRTYVQNMNEKNDNEEEEEYEAIFKDKNPVLKKSHTEIFPSSTSDVSKRKDSSTQLHNTFIQKKNKKHLNIPLILSEKEFSLSAKFSYPLTKRIDLYSRLGITLNISQEFLSNFKHNQKSSFENKIFPIFALGTQYKFTEKFLSRIEIENKMDSLQNKDFSNSSINFNLIWVFDNSSSQNSRNNVPCSTHFLKI